MKTSWHDTPGTATQTPCTTPLLPAGALHAATTGLPLTSTDVGRAAAGDTIVASSRAGGHRGDRLHSGDSTSPRCNTPPSTQEERVLGVHSTTATPNGYVPGGHNLLGKGTATTGGTVPIALQREAVPLRAPNIKGTACSVWSQTNPNVKVRVEVGGRDHASVTLRARMLGASSFRTVNALQVTRMRTEICHKEAGGEPLNPMMCQRKDRTMPHTTQQR